MTLGLNFKLELLLMYFIIVICLYGCLFAMEVIYVCISVSLTNRKAKYLTAKPKYLLKDLKFVLEGTWKPQARGQGQDNNTG